ncbi:MAG: DNA repair protein RecN [Elusimicrobia bacterium]|nr:DNA repair protein RecN [Elusimicrobiota bacterium]
MRILLESLKIRNFALLEDASMRIGSGFSVITGETGAGKSILIGALSMVLGESVGREVVRSGAEECEVEAEFSLGEHEQIKQFLKVNDLGEDELILRRIFYLKGRSKCYINSHVVTLALLKELGNFLVDIHSQNQHQALLKESHQMKLLDRFSGSDALVGEAGTLWREYTGLRDEKQRMNEKKQGTEKEIERLRHEAAEIDSAGLREGLDEEVENEYKLLSNIEAVSSGVNEIYGTLYEKEGSVMEEMADTIRRLEDFTGYDSRLGGVKESVLKAQYELESACDSLRSYKEELDYDQDHFEEVLGLRRKIADLKLKYGGDIKDIMKYREELDKEIFSHDNYRQIMEKLDKDLAAGEKKLSQALTKLSGLRAKGARKLSKKVEEKLKSLGMGEAEFEVRLIPSGMGPAGKEDIRYYIMTNPGEARLELSRIASGGEISRVMLAVKASLADSDDIPILVFDEIDTGIGATIGGCVGAELDKLSGFHQVIAVTHLPQIAVKAGFHIKVDKEVSGNRTRTVIKELDGEGRAEEISRMFGGAREILDGQAKIKEMTGKKR